MKNLSNDSSSIWHIMYGNYYIGGSCWNRLKLKIAVFRYRVRDAYTVLHGKAFIED